MWKSDEYQVIGQPTSGIPMYKVECVAGGRTRILLRNLLLPLLEKIRQPGGLEVEDLPSSDEEEDEEDGMPGVTRAVTSIIRARRRNTTPQSSPTQQMKATGKYAFADQKSKVPSDFRQLSDRLNDESSEEVVHRLSILPHYSIRFYYNRKYVFPSGPYNIQRGRAQYS